MNAEEVLALMQTILDSKGRLVLGSNYPKRPDVIIGSDEPGRIPSKPSTCADCKAVIWLSDGWVMVRRWPDVPILCLKCAAARRRSC